MNSVNSATIISLVDSERNNDILFEMFGFIAKGYCQRDLESLTLR